MKIPIKTNLNNGSLKKTLPRQKGSEKGEKGESRMRENRDVHFFK